MTAQPQGPSQSEEFSERFVQKVLRNRYYATLWRRTLDPKTLLYAGFFDDGLAFPVTDYAWFKENLPLASYRSISKRYADSLLTLDKPAQVKRVVLVSTGAYSPAHVGHLSMLKQARIHCENQGWTVLGGFLSPSHDLYVNQKANGAAKQNCAIRIQALNELLAQGAGLSDWLAIHPWESVCAPCPLNFTDVLDRIEQELGRYLPLIECAPVELVYVFGSDNQGFINAFTAPELKNRIGLCVGRLEPEKFTVSKLPLLNLPYEWRVPGSPGEAPLSSSQIRPYYDWQNSEYPYREEYGQLNSKGHPLYIVRSDLKESVPPALQNRVPDTALNAFLSGLLTALGNALPEGVCIRSVPVVPAFWEQGVGPPGTLVLDKPLGRLIQDNKIKGQGVQLAQVSRVFELSGTQQVPLYMHSDLDRVLADTLANSITQVLDDDRGSGRTSAWVLGEFTRRGLKKPVFQYTLNSVLEDDTHLVFDVVDARDFLLGFSAAGLVVELSGSPAVLARAPYWSPFVNLVTRAKLLPALQKDFTVQILQLNIAFFAACANSLGDVRVCDLDSQSQAFLKHCGFTSSDSALKVVESFLNQIC